MAEVWEDLRRSGGEVDEAVYNAAAGAFARTGDMGRARGLVDDFLAEGLQPGVRMCVARCPRTPCARACRDGSLPRAGTTC